MSTAICTNWPAEKPCHCRVGTQGEGHAVVGTALDVGDDGAQLADGEHGVDEFEVAVDAVRRGERLGEAELRGDRLKRAAR